MDKDVLKQQGSRSTDFLEKLHSGIEHGSYRNDLTALRQAGDRKTFDHLRWDGMEDWNVKDGIDFGFNKKGRWNDMEKKDPLTEGTEKFSDILMKKDNKNSANNFAFSSDSGNFGLRGAKPVSSHSNQSSVSLHSTRKTTSSFLGLPLLRRGISGASQESKEITYPNSLARQFLESASRSGQASDVMAHAIYRQDYISRASKCIGSKNVDLSTMLTSQLVDSKLYDVKVTPKDFIIPEYGSLDYCEFLANELTSVETRLKFYLTTIVLQKEQSTMRNLDQFEKLSDDLASLFKQIIIMKGQIKLEYMKDMELDFSRKNDESFMNRFEDVVNMHLEKVKALEGRLYQCKILLEEKKLQLRKLENLIKFTNMVDDFKRNMKLSQKLKEYYGIIGDLLFFFMLLFIFNDIYRRWFV